LTLLSDVGVAVGKPPFEDAPYGDDKAKDGMVQKNTWDESDEEDFRSSEEDVIPRVSLPCPDTLSDHFSVPPVTAKVQNPLDVD
jgi:hypothetical protein